MRREAIKNTLGIRYSVFVLLVCLGPISPASAQDDYLERGNAFIARESYVTCQALFEEALQGDPNNNVYRSQLALCLAKQGKHEAGKEQLDLVLSVEPDNVGALWYLSVNRYLAGDYRGSILHFEAVAPLLDERVPQHAPLSWYVGSAYRELLRSEGLTYDETDAMLSAFRQYLGLQPESDGRDQLEAWLAWVEENRPQERKAERWMALAQAPVQESSGGEGKVFGESIEEIELPEAAAGFVWRKLPDFGAAFQMPKDWHFKQEARDATQGFFMTKENIDELGYFRTGLTVNLIRNAQARVGKRAVEYAEAFAALACAKGKKLDAWQRQTGVLRAFTCTVANTDEARPIVVHHLAIGNERTDTLYIMIFESLAETWAEEWKAAGAKMMELFLIDDEI